MKRLEHMVDLDLPRGDHVRFILETDWSSGHAGYMLFVDLLNGQRVLVDLGSRVNSVTNSFYLGALDTIIWACKRTKAFRSSVPLLINTDNHGVIGILKAKILQDDVLRSFRLWAWLIYNEPGFLLEFKPGTDNTRANLLNRPNITLGTLEMRFHHRKDDKENSSGCKEICQIETDRSEGALEQKVWEKSLEAHCGIWNIFRSMRSKGFPVSLRIVRKVVSMCEICAKF